MKGKERDVRDPVASSDRSFQVSISQDLEDLIPLCSTPARGMPDGQPLNLSATFSNSDVDVTGVTSVNLSVLPAVQNSILLSSKSSFNALDGNPFSVFEPKEGDDNGDVDDDDDDVVSVSSDKSADDPDSFGLFTEDLLFTNRLGPVIEQFRRISDSEDSDDDSDFVGFIDSVDDMDAMQIDDHTKLLCEDMDISLDDEPPLTMIQDVDASDLIQESLPVPVQEYGVEASISQGIEFEGATVQGSDSELPGLDAEHSKKVEDNKGDILAALHSSLTNLTSIGEELRDFAMLHQRSRHVVSVEKLLELAGSKCDFDVDGFPCLAVLNHSTNKIGGNVEVTSRCVNGHSKKWVSSEVLSYKQGQPVYLNDSLLPPAILVSGNNYEKFGLVCKP